MQGDDMGSSRGQDRSLGSGLSFPQWMKGRGEARYDFDQNSFSPPSHDDSFLCIRYPSRSSKSALDGQDGYRSISQVLNETKSSSTVQSTPASTSGPSNISTNIRDIKSIDFSKHPLPCQPFVPAAEGKEAKPVSSVGPKQKAIKSLGTDDGFHSEPALCGKSIVHVANRIMSRKVVKMDPAIEATENSTVRNQQFMEQQDMMRKGSKSLPVSPIASPMSTPDTSPKTRRRTNANRYFTGPFVPDRDKYQGGWLMASILGQSRDIAGATNKIQEEDESPPSLESLPSKFLNRKKSISSQNLSYMGRNDQQQQQQDESKQTGPIYTNVFQPKPSELREMNFWSPTSM